MSPQLEIIRDGSMEETEFKTDHELRLSRIS